jgi:histidinol-phosphate phosphatase family protein
MTTALRPAVFLDKDGTLVHDVPYNVDPQQLRFTPHAIEALRLLQAAGWPLIVVTNQPGIALGLFDQTDWQRLAAGLTERLAEHGVELAGIHACPHAPALDAAPAGCICRKPAPGLLRQAAREHRIDLAGSWMVGDILNDVEAGRRAGCRTVLLDVGNETEWVWSPRREPHHRCSDLLQAAQHILAGEMKPPRSHPSLPPEAALAADQRSRIHATPWPAGTATTGTARSAMN